MTVVRSFPDGMSTSRMLRPKRWEWLVGVLRRSNLMSCNSWPPVAAGARCGGLGRLVSRHCEEPTGPAFCGSDDELRDEAIQSCFAASWIASRSLSSGAHSRDPLARNDAGAAS